jgi:hypothetical protein
VITYNWQAGDWGTCDCDTFQLARTVSCKGSDGSTASSETKCTQSKPTTSRSCITPCYSWKVKSTYGACDCSIRKQTQEYECWNNVTNSTAILSKCGTPFCYPQTDYQIAQGVDPICVPYVLRKSCTC